MKKVSSGSKPLFAQLGKLTTEWRNPRSSGIDRLPVVSVLKVINAEDARVAGAVRRELPRIARAVGLVARALGEGGRLEDPVAFVGEQYLERVRVRRRAKLDELRDVEDDAFGLDAERARGRGMRLDARQDSCSE